MAFVYYCVCEGGFLMFRVSHGADRPMVAKLLSLVYEKRYCVRSERKGKVGWEEVVGTWSRDGCMSGYIEIIAGSHSPTWTLSCSCRILSCHGNGVGVGPAGLG